MVIVVQRVENGLIALAVLLATIAFEQPWWILFAAFLAFDLSALGYLVNARFGGAAYNVVHNFSGPALAAAAWCMLLITGREATWLVLLAACWAFHVAVDRALGYGLKEQDFTHTHLGPIGRAARESSTRRRTFTAIGQGRGAVS